MQGLEEVVLKNIQAGFKINKTTLYLVTVFHKYHKDFWEKFINRVSVIQYYINHNRIRNPQPYRLYARCKVDYKFNRMLAGIKDIPHIIGDYPLNQREHMVVIECKDHKAFDHFMLGHYSKMFHPSFIQKNYNPDKLKVRAERRLNNNVPRSKVLRLYAIGLRRYYVFTKSAVYKELIENDLAITIGDMELDSIPDLENEVYYEETD